MPGNGLLSTILAVTNTGGIVGVLVVVLWLGLRGDVVTADQLADCRAARDSYLREWIRALHGPSLVDPTSLTRDLLDGGR